MMHKYYYFIKEQLSQIFFYLSIDNIIAIKIAYTTHTDALTTRITLPINHSVTFLDNK